MGILINFFKVTPVTYSLVSAPQKIKKLSTNYKITF